MKTKSMPFGAAAVLLALLSLILVVAACSDDDSDADPTATEVSDEPAAAETSVDVSLTEFVLEPSVESVPAGTVTFNVSSNGAIFHNLKVVATDLAPDGLPTDDATFGVDESQVNIVGSTADLDPGDTEELTLDLEAGNYVLICNIPTHYDIGMTVAFTVE